MNHYLVSFPSAALAHVSPAALPAVSESSRAAIRQAKAAGVYVFGGGLDEAVPPVLVSASGAVAPGGYPAFSGLNGGFCVLKVATRAEAEQWAAKIAQGCTCAQELRVFMFDPES